MTFAAENPQTQFVWDKLAKLNGKASTMPQAHKPKVFAKADFSAFNANAQKLHMAPRQLAMACGYTDSTGNQWARAGKVPQAALLASEALVRRQGPAKANSTQHLVISVAGDKVDLLRQFVSAIGGALAELKLP